MTTVYLNLKSANAKTGPIPVSTTSASTCPDACPLKKSGCYAEHGPLGNLWRLIGLAKPGGSVASARGTIRTLTWSAFCNAISALPTGTLWRHNQAGDLPGEGDHIDATQLSALVDANEDKCGFTYTHKPVLGADDGGNRVNIAVANRRGFTINLSANNLAEADALTDLRIAPVVTILPADVQGKRDDITTPAGRKVAVCPATYREDVSCASCQLCQRQERKVIVGFPAHGPAKRKASAIATAA